MLVVQEIWDTETSSFWQRPGVDPKTIQTEVLLLPAAFFMEKDGIDHELRRDGAVAARRGEAAGAGQARRRDVDAVFRRVRDLVHDSTEPKDEPIRRPTGTTRRAEDVLQGDQRPRLRDVPETELKTGDYLGKVADLQPDGSTSCGAWIYAGVFAGGENLSKRRDSRTDPGGLGLFPNFGWTWPNNMRVLYNRASCDAKGKPYPGLEADRVVGRARQKRWAGYDIPTFRYLTDGPDTPKGQQPFHLNAEGVGTTVRRRLRGPRHEEPDGYPRDASYVPKDGPLPEMYEPVESPVANVLHPKARNNPMLKYPRVESHQPIGNGEDYPYVLMTSTVAEHWCAGSTTRNIPWLNELVPEPMIEMPVVARARSSASSGRQGPRLLGARRGRR